VSGKSYILRHRPLQVSVNLSPKQFMQRDLIDQISLALDSGGLSPASLKVKSPKAW
jgi:FOG: EAL domain